MYGILTDERNSYVLCYGNSYGNEYGTLKIRHTRFCGGKLCHAVHVTPRVYVELRGGPKKVSRYQFSKKNRIEACQ